MNQPDIATILRTTRTIAMVGISSNPSRPSNSVARYLLAEAPEYRLFFVNPHETEVFGRPVYPSLSELPEVPDLVDVFRRVEQLPEVAADAVAVGARTLWFQLGLIHEAAASTARAAGLTVVQDRCIEMEHAHRTRHRSPRNGYRVD